MAQIPHHLVKVSKRWYQNSIDGKFIKADQLNSYIDKRKRELDQEAKQEQVLKARWDLNY